MVGHERQTARTCGIIYAAEADVYRGRKEERTYFWTLIARKKEMLGLPVSATLFARCPVHLEVMINSKAVFHIKQDSLILFPNNPCFLFLLWALIYLLTKSLRPV